MYGLFAILLVTNILLLVFGFGAIRYLRHITRIPSGLLYPAVTVLCFAGAFAVNNSVFDWVIMVAGSVAGCVMRKTGVPIPPLVIAMLLAPDLENNIRQSLSLSEGSYAVFVQSPTAAALLSVTLVVLAFFVWRSMKTDPFLSQPLKGQPK